jgi:hypothetical protein
MLERCVVVMSYPGLRAAGGVLALLAAMSPASAADAGAGPRLGERRTLATFPAAGGTYELGLEACKLGEQEHSPRLFRCRFSVRLSVGGKVVSQADLPYLACGAPEPMEVDRLLGADPRAQGWRSSDDCEVQVAARAVEMAPGTVALLVTQRTGSEAYYRHHQLYLTAGGKVALAWEHGEEQGRDWSTTSVLPGQPHREDVALVEVTGAPPEGARSIRATRLHLDGPGGKIVESPLPDARAPLFVVQVGRYPVAKEAYQARRSDCLSDHQVLNGRLFPGLHLKDFFVGMVVATRAQAKDTLDRLAGCPDRPRGAIHVYRRAQRRPR